MLRTPNTPRGAAAQDAARVVALMTSAAAPWRWRIIARNGQILRESVSDFSSVVDALADGESHAGPVTSACAASGPPAQATAA